MKYVFVIVISLLLLVLPSGISAQGMMGQFGTANSSSSTVDEQTTAQDEAKGKEIFDKLKAKQTTCGSLTDDDFDVLGDYFMGQRLGSTATHAAMNAMMTRMMGETGEKQMHISLGKRLSGCNPSAPISDQGKNFLPMMGLGGMMGGNGGNSGWGMMGTFGNASTSFLGMNTGYIFMALWWLAGILVVVFLVKLITGTGKTGKGLNALEILKERYAKGEITKKEFDQMKNEID